MRGGGVGQNVRAMWCSQKYKSLTLLQYCGIKHDSGEAFCAHSAGIM